MVALYIQRRDGNVFRSLPNYGRVSVQIKRMFWLSSTAASLAVPPDVATARPKDPPCAGSDLTRLRWKGRGADFDRCVVAKNGADIVN
jgi:hypothetical protein